MKLNSKQLRLLREIDPTRLTAEEAKQLHEEDIAAGRVFPDSPELAKRERQRRQRKAYDERRKAEDPEGYKLASQLRAMKSRLKRKAEKAEGTE